MKVLPFPLVWTRTECSGHDHLYFTKIDRTPGRSTYRYGKVLWVFGRNNSTVAALVLMKEVEDLLFSFSFSRRWNKVKVGACLTNHANF